jgi:hypothetical protein
MNKKRPAKKTFSSGFCKTKKNKEFNNKKSISKFAEGNKNKRFCSEDNITENSSSLCCECFFFFIYYNYIINRN